METNTAVLLLFMTTIASSGKPCPPKSIKSSAFEPKDLNGIYRVVYCMGPELCAGLNCADYTVCNQQGMNFDIYASAFNKSSNKMSELEGTLEIIVPGHYKICGLSGASCDTYRVLKLTTTYLIEFACVLDKEGRMQYGSWVSARNKSNLDEKHLVEIKKTIKDNGLEWNDYLTADNINCEKVDEMRTPRCVKE